MRQSIRTIMRNEGFLGFYKGANVIIVGTVVQRGSVMATYELVYSGSENHFPGLASEIPHTGGVQKKTVLSGMCAGVVRSILECPFEYIKVRQ